MSSTDIGIILASYSPLAPVVATVDSLPEGAHAAEAREESLQLGLSECQERESRQRSDHRYTFSRVCSIAHLPYEYVFQIDA